MSFTDCFHPSKSWGLFESPFYFVKLSTSYLTTKWLKWLLNSFSWPIAVLKVVCLLGQLMLRLLRTSAWAYIRLSLLLLSFLRQELLFILFIFSSGWYWFSIPLSRVFLTAHFKAWHSTVNNVCNYSWVYCTVCRGNGNSADFNRTDELENKLDSSVGWRCIAYCHKSTLTLNLVDRFWYVNGFCIEPRGRCVTMTLYITCEKTKDKKA